MFKLLLWFSLTGLFVLDVNADQLKTALKGKMSAAQIHYGDVISFDGTALIFDEILEGGTFKEDLRTRPAAHFLPTQFKPSEVEIIINLNIEDPQSPVNANEFAQSLPSKTKDVDLQRYEAQQAQKEKASQDKQTPESRDLLKCSSRGIDEVIEKASQSSRSKKPPVLGTLVMISGGYAEIKRASDGALMKYRLDDLSTIGIGICQ